MGLLNSLLSPLSGLVQHVQNGVQQARDSVHQFFGQGDANSNALNSQNLQQMQQVPHAQQVQQAQAQAQQNYGPGRSNGAPPPIQPPDGSAGGFMAPNGGGGLTGFVHGILGLLPQAQGINVASDALRQANQQNAQ